MTTTTRSVMGLFGVAAMAGTIGVIAARADTPPAAPPPAAPHLMHWPDLLNRPLPAATKRIAYGPAPEEFGELWLPDGPGPFPVVLMVHGGCWQAGVAKLSIMNYAAEDLRKRGIAVWNIEYRGEDQAGGGYPGTFQDVALATDALKMIGPQYKLKTDRIVALGHSAGGHLVFWLAARGDLLPASPVRSTPSLPLFAAVSIGGLPDLKAARALGDASCGADAIDALVGPPTAQHSDVYADTSPVELPANSVPELLVSGADDHISPPAVGAAYTATMKAKGETVSQIVVPDSGHVELIAPGSAAWDRIVAEVSGLLGVKP